MSPNSEINFGHDDDHVATLAGLVLRKFQEHAQRGEVSMSLRSASGPIAEQMLAGASVLYQARFTVELVARLLNTTTEGVYVLTKQRLLKPLGHPPPNGTKYYARGYILRLCEDEAWLARASDTLVKYKWDKNHINKED